MSLLKANSVQIGQSATATQNFTLSVPSSPDGTIKLARGNSGATTADVLTVNASGAITGATISSSTITGSTISGATITGSTTTGGNLTLATAVATTGSSVIDFTGIPSWVKRVTVMFDRVSLSGVDDHLIQIGTASTLSTSSYESGSGSSSSTAGFVIRSQDASYAVSGIMVLATLGGNLWTSSHSVRAGGTNAFSGGGIVQLSEVLTRVRITKTGTNTFDGSGTVNIMYEG
jgi:hypothetical protein